MNEHIADWILAKHKHCKLCTGRFYGRAVGSFILFLAVVKVIFSFEHLVSVLKLICRKCRGQPLLPPVLDCSFHSNRDTDVKVKHGPLKPSTTQPCPVCGWKLLVVQSLVVLVGDWLILVPVKIKFWKMCYILQLTRVWISFFSWRFSPFSR